MLIRTRRIRRTLPALLLASALPLSLAACEGKGEDKAGGSSTADASEDSESPSPEDPGSGDNDGDGTGPGKSSPSADPGNGDQDGGRTDVGPCDDKSHLRIAMRGVKQVYDNGSVVITAKNTGSVPCVLPDVLGLILHDENDARVPVDNVQVNKTGSEVALGSGATASATLNYSADRAKTAVAAAQLDFDQIGRVAVEPSAEAPMNMAGGTVQLTAFKTR